VNSHAAAARTATPSAPNIHHNVPDDCGGASSGGACGTAGVLEGVGVGDASVVAAGVADGLAIAVGWGLGVGVGVGAGAGVGLAFGVPALLATGGVGVGVGVAPLGASACGTSGGGAIGKWSAGVGVGVGIGGSVVWVFCPGGKLKCCRSGAVTVFGGRTGVVELLVCACSAAGIMPASNSPYVARDRAMRINVFPTMPALVAQS
jgi:hypothetical protein